MSPRIYKPDRPPVDIPDCSVFSFLFPKVDRFPGNAAAFIDPDTGLVLTRADLRSKSLELAHGLRYTLNTTFGGPKLVWGDTVLVFRCVTTYFQMNFGLTACHRD